MTTETNTIAGSVAKAAGITGGSAWLLWLLGYIHPIAAIIGCFLFVFSAAYHFRKKYFEAQKAKLEFEETKAQLRLQSEQNVNDKKES